MKSSMIDDRVQVGEQPTDQDLATLAAAGVHTVVNLRRAGERNQPLDPAAEATAAAAAGLAYHHIPVSTSDLHPEQIEAVRAVIGNAAGPVYIHCGMGQRASALALTALAPETGQTADDVIAQARDTGFPVIDAELDAFIRRSLDRQA